MPTNNPTGRPSIFTPDLAAAICARLADGQTLREICRADDMPHRTTVAEWVLQDRGGFAVHYAAARELGYQTMADELLEIADDGSNDWTTRNGEPVPNGEVVNRSRLRLDTRKWLLSKALPKIYGDRIEHSGPNGGAIPFVMMGAHEAPSAADWQAQHAATGDEA